MTERAGIADHLAVELSAMSVSPMFRSLEHRNARWVFAGLLISNVGTWAQMTATSLVVYRLTGKATDVGITLFCQFLPMLLLGVWAGAVADRVDKRKMAVLTQLGLAAQAFVFAGVELAGLASIPAVYVLSLLLGVLGALDNPARRGFVVEMVEPANIANAISLNTAVMTGSRVVGPALAALLLRWLDPGCIFLINGISFTAIVMPLLRVDVSQLHRSPPAQRGGTPVRDALRFVAGNPRLRLVFVVFTVVGTFAFNYSVSLLKLSDARFGDERWFPWMLAATGLGSMTGALVTGARRRVGSAWFFGSALVLGVSGLALAWSPSIAVALVMALPLGAGGAAFIAALNSISQLDSPPDMRGRLLALGAVAFLGTTPIGAPITGRIADSIAAEWSLGYGSVTTLVIAAVGIVLRRRSAQVPAAEHEAAALGIDDSDRRGVVVQVVGGGDL
jgi:MFS family permease